MNTYKPITIITLSLAALGFMFGCDGKGHSDNPANKRGTPVLVTDTLVYDADSKTFTLKMRADSTADASVTFFLCEGDSILQECSDGVFNKVPPQEEGYNVQAKVEWSDTTIITPMRHLTGFVLPSEPVEKIPLIELQSLINSMDKSLKLGNNEHISQSVLVSTDDGKTTALQDVFLNLDNNVWSSVEVVKVSYDDNNLVTEIVLKPKETSVVREDIDPELFDEY